jgi:putative pyruvate formate lyase activating enzyme
MTAVQVGDRLRDLYSPCVLCERRCGAHRTEGETGTCGLANEVFVYNRLIHLGEEGPLSPSYAIFLSGCSLACTFCSEWRHLQPPFERAPTTADELANAVISDLERAPARARPKNINFVGGEPTVALPFVAEFLAAADAIGAVLPAVLLNTNGFLTPSALALSTHLAELFVVDLKFGNDRCAQQVAGVGRYWGPLTRNLRALARQAFDDDARGNLHVPLMPVTLWVRHLLMPGHLECCTEPSLAWLADNAPDAHVNVMPAFVPSFGDPRTRWPELSPSERHRAEVLLRDSRIMNAFFDGRSLRK